MKDELSIQVAASHYRIAKKNVIEVIKRDFPVQTKVYWKDKQINKFGVVTGYSGLTVNVLENGKVLTDCLNPLILTKAAGKGGA